MDYKDTLHMPKTDFEMRGNLVKKEPKIQKRWQDIDLYGKMLEKRKDAQPFVLHDGPPYANGDIHLGHALNKILKDTIVIGMHLIDEQGIIIRAETKVKAKEDAGRSLAFLEDQNG